MRLFILKSGEKPYLCKWKLKRSGLHGTLFTKDFSAVTAYLAPIGCLCDDLPRKFIRSFVHFGDAKIKRNFIMYSNLCFYLSNFNNKFTAYEQKGTTGQSI